MKVFDPGFSFERHLAHQSNRLSGWDGPKILQDRIVESGAGLIFGVGTDRQIDFSDSRISRFEPFVLMKQK